MLVGETVGMHRLRVGWRIQRDSHVWEHIDEIVDGCQRGEGGKQELCQLLRFLCVARIE